MFEDEGGGKLEKKVTRDHKSHAVQAIEELIRPAKEMREANRQGEEMGLTDEELAFYDALEANDSAAKAPGESTLRTMAQELLETLTNNITVDLMIRENARAQLRVLIKCVLHRYGCHPDKQGKATQTVVQQVEMLQSEWMIHCTITEKNTYKCPYKLYKAEKSPASRPLKAMSVSFPLDFLL